MKFVLYTTGDGWAVTTLKNYRAYIQDARKISRFPAAEGWTPETILTYYTRFTSAKLTDFVSVPY